MKEWPVNGRTDSVCGFSMKPELKILAASGQLGYGIPEEAFRRGVAAAPDVIGADMGSIDPGPYCLGSGETVVAGPGDCVDIAVGQAHRIANQEDEELVIIEVQRGAYTGEDDIVRLEDDYGRSDQTS